MELKYSKSRIDKAGEALKKGYFLSEEELGKSLEIVSSWRDEHAMPLNVFAKTLRSRVGQISDSPDTMVVQRLKRTPSILLKLKTHKTMRLSAMQDIGGLRAILDDMASVNKLVELYRTSRSRHELFAIDDYIARPKEDGYRSVHLVYKLKQNPGLFIEIQIRSHLQHVWATAVEVFGTLKNSSFKSGHGEKKWLDFFKLLSSVFAWKEGVGPVAKELLNELKEKINSLQAIQNLNLYTSVYKVIEEENKGAGRKGLYFLILLNSHENKIYIKQFPAGRFKDAAMSYIEKEQKFYNDTNVNVVLVHPGDAKKLRASYPNYFMDTKALLRYLSEIMMDRFL